jgi:hypothetical protein
MPVRTPEHLFGMSFGKQASIAVPAPIIKFWRLTKLNTEVPLPQLAIEDDAAEMGKGDEFATQTFPTSWSVGSTIRKFLTSQSIAWLLGFGLGKVVVTGSSAPFTYTITPQNPVTDGVELPYFSALYQYRPAVPILDQELVGCAIEDWSITINSGPGRQNSQFTCNYVGSGIFVDPSTLTMPAVTPEVILPASVATVTINGVDYVANKGLLSLTITGKNNLSLDTGFFIGSGFQTAGNTKSGAVRGRLEFGTRTYGLSFVVRLATTSAEFAALKAQTSGTAVITLAADANNSFSMTYYSITYKTTTLGDSDGFATVQVDCAVKKDPTLGVLSATVLTTQGGIAQ